MILFLTAMMTTASAQEDVSIEDLYVLPGVVNDAGDEVVGGKPVTGKRWQDTVGIVMYNQYVGCTGTLIAPNVVLTAGHCVGGISSVLVGSNDWYSDQGEIIEVKQVHEYPNSWASYDIAVLKLSKDSSYTPRTLALDCIRDDYFVDGANVAVVGYGATTESGGGQTSEKMWGITQVQDVDCDETYIDGVYSGCNASVSPGGEVGAGGNGVDACFGDSGGPLYLMTDRGDYLAGVTSRAYAGVSQNAPCRDGGIYVRPDAVIKWIERKAKVELDRPQCNFAPEPTAEPIVTGRGDTGFTTVFHNDPDDFHKSYTYEIVQQPEHGEATVNAEGEVEFSPKKGFAGEDFLTVRVTDDGSKYEASGPEWAELDVNVTVGSGAALSAGAGQCGCSNSGTPVGLLWLAPLMLAVRRR